MSPTSSPSQAKYKCFLILDGYENFGGSFNFSKFPNLRGLEFGFTVDWGEGYLPWIPIALSTLRPATSPRLSTIRLDFSGSSTIDRSVETFIEETGSDLRQIADEVARIDREFGGAVDFTVAPDSKFKVVFDRLYVTFHLQR